MRVDQTTFIRQYAPLSLLALTAHAMYYGEGDYANRRMSSKQIGAALELDREQVWKLLDIADSMLELGMTERRVRL